VGVVSSFLGQKTGTKAPTKSEVKRIKEKSNAENNILETTFTGGWGAKPEAEIEAGAIKIASRIRTLKDLGWKKPERRAGNIRPRHRAFGGSGEKPVQLKANYDESKEMCVEKWLTQDEFYTLVKDSSPAADTVYVALAKGASYAERDVCEKLLLAWRPNGKTFDEARFMASVKSGRTELAAGWALFLSLNGFFASSIVFPTNPLAKGLEQVIAQIQASI